MNNEIRGLIYSQYKNESQLARKLNWPKQRLNKIVNGKKTPNLVEVRELSSALNVDLYTLFQIFLDDMSPNGQLFIGGESTCHSAQSKTVCSKSMN